MKLIRPYELGRLEWCRERTHRRVHRKPDDCAICRAVDYERHMQMAAAHLRERMLRGEFRHDDPNHPTPPQESDG